MLKLYILCPSQQNLRQSNTVASIAAAWYMELYERSRKLTYRL